MFTCAGVSHHSSTDIGLALLLVVLTPERMAALSHPKAPLMRLTRLGKAKHIDWYRRKGSPAVRFRGFAARMKT